MRKFFALLLSISILFPACSEEDRVWYLDLGSEVRAYVLADDKGLEIKVPETLLSEFSKDSGLSVEDVLESFFGSGVKGSADGERFLKLEKLLLSETGKESMVDAYVAYGTDLADTIYFSMLDELSPDFPDGEILDAFKGLRHYGSYELGEMFPDGYSYDDAVSYIHLWLERAEETGE